MTDLRARLQATLGDAYTIERELGGGGMSRVFLADEHGLGRKVVIKVLPSEAAGTLSVERFKREIQFAAALQQANIVPVLNAGETGGVPFYTMPYVDGESLRARLATSGALDIPEAIGWLKEIARALSHAHGRHVVHRDIKPDNILISGGSAMVTDFGIAKALSDSASAGAGALTGTGITLGTPAYMAPEQASGDARVDHRADIYAFGCLAYEMLTGAPPFAGQSPQAMLASHLTRDPEPIEEKRDRLPKALASLVSRCLAKDPAERPQSAIELVYALDDLSAPPPSHVPFSAARIRRGPVVALAAFVVIALASLAILPVLTRTRQAGSRSVAVLPFENTSRDTTIDYLEDGISDHVRDAVARLTGVTVKARSSSRRLKGKPAREAGRALGASLILLGTVSRAGPRIHVTAEIVHAADENAMWSDSFDGPVEAMPSIQDSLVHAISVALSVSTTRGRSERGTADPVAYDEFLRGRFEGDRTNWEAALRHFRAAAERDPGFARAHANVAIAYSNIPTVGIAAADSFNVLARSSAARALAIDSTVADAYLALSNVKANELLLADAITPLERAIALDPTTVESRVAYGLGLMQIGRVDAGLAAMRRAFAMDPLSSMATGVLAYGWLMAGHPDSAIVRGRAGASLDPDNILIRQVLAEALAFSGARDSASVEYERAYHLGPDRFDGRANLIYARIAAGREADALGERALLDREGQSNSPFYRRALADVALGRTDSAMAELERSVDAREPMFSLISLPCDPRFDPLKRNVRFASLIKRLGATPCAPRLAWPFVG
ncbi:MAG TPA: protein kinase, partial [Gemmatimonadaceae bacterium]|nr:protein kinase [Gemmatimonadaceae bacterium]